ncbi:hypothetical protein D915_001562 [Fasciola hepatica]|uniref:Eukaryotic translation initiation factor 4E transporter n=1 Tax=Fasciola hepatica TaxID=6192 RepID=A0A4E0RLV0_FASHE|nr:hypothetical protein D915_001562 [Fasciola hepatica]
MDSTDVLQPNKKRRLIYDREALLAVKRNTPPADLTIYDSLTRVNTSACQRGGRGKTRASTTSKIQNGCTRDSTSLVLGPQKRTWNTGCHVSHSSGREPLDAYSLGSRGGKNGSEYRFPERHPRGSSDFKRDYRGGHSISRDRGVARRPDGVSFCRSQAKDERHARDGRMSLQEEPEWFSEGPTTVNETIELGGILEEVGDDVQLTLPMDRHRADEVACVGDAKVSSDNVEADLGKKPNEASALSGSCKDDFQVPVTTISQLNLFDALPIPKNKPSQGSRFKHLFVKAETETPTTKSNINDQLLQLLKGSSTPGSTLHDKNNGGYLFLAYLLLVIQVENKLRSILLGHNGPRANENRSVSSENKGSKPQVLTVEEIEAQLNSPQNQAPETHSVVTERLSVISPEKTNDEILKHFTPSPSMGSNLAPMLQSLALKQQQQQQQQVVCAQSVQLRSALNTIGMLSNPMVRLPTSANAVSASARINQLQQADFSGTSSLSDFTSGQQALRQMWDSVPATGNHIPPPQLQPATGQLCTNPSRPIGPSHCLLADLSSRPIFGPVNPSNPSNASAPRRPIVKVQQSTTSNHSYSSLSPLVAPNAVNSSSMGPNLSDVDRRLLNLALRQQQANINGPRGIAERFPIGGALHSTQPPDMRFPPPGLPQNTGSPLIHPVANTNNSAFLASRARSTLQSENALAFLSQLVERDRLACPGPSSNFGSFLSSGIKAKTLEEIEHQEVTSSGSFL